jgi:multiple sugar transport system substrate-binding protein
MASVKRRSIVAGAGIAGILASGRMPAFGQTSTVHWLRWTDFVPASDKALRESILPEAEKALGIKVNFETVNANDLQPRITAGIQSGSGPDLIMLNNNHPHLYAASLVDVSDLTEEFGKAGGGYYPLAKANCHDGKNWISIPWAVIGAMNVYRKSWFAEVGYNTFPDTWEAYRDAGKKLKAKGRPLGQALGHSFGDPPTFAYPYLWSWGGKEVDESGKVVINSKETIESLRFMVGFWKDAFDEGGLAWDDTNNNLAYLSQTISATLNGASIYIASTRDPQKYETEKKGVLLKDDSLHAPLPKGPAGQFGFHTFHSHVMPKYSKNQAATRNFVKWMHSQANYDKWFRSQEGFATGTTQDTEKNTLWSTVPVMEPFRIAGKLGQAVGYAGPPNAKAAEVLSKYIIVDMYAKAVQGMAPEAAAKWAEDELKKIYV